MGVQAAGAPRFMICWGVPSGSVFVLAIRLGHDRRVRDPLGTRTVLAFCAKAPSASYCGRSARARKGGQIGRVNGRVGLFCRNNFGECSMRIQAFTIAVSLLVSSVLAGSSLAQPLPAPASYPPVVGEKGVVSTHEISLDMAEKIARGGIEACRKMGFHTTMVV